MFIKILPCFMHGSMLLVFFLVVYYFLLILKFSFYRAHLKKKGKTNKQTNKFYFLPSPLGNPQDKSCPLGLGWGIVWSSPVLGVGGGWNKKISSLWFCEVLLFLAWLTQWLQTSGLHIFKEKWRNLSESGWRGRNLSKLKSVFKGMF